MPAPEEPIGDLLKADVRSEYLRIDAASVEQQRAIFQERARQVAANGGTPEEVGYTENPPVVFTLAAVLDYEAAMVLINSIAGQLEGDLSETADGQVRAAVKTFGSVRDIPDAIQIAGQMLIEALGLQDLCRISQIRTHRPPQPDSN